MQDFLTGLSTNWQMSMPSFQEALLHLLMAFVLAIPLTVVYRLTHHGVSYSRSTVQALVLLSLIVTIVMLAIGDSLARAFGLFGALALVRFRTPIKDTKDTVFLFLAVGIGITVGTGNFMLAMVGTAFTLATALYLDRTGAGTRFSHDAVLRLRLPWHEDQESRLQTVLARHCASSLMLRAREGLQDGEMELSFQIELRHPDRTAGLLSELRALPGAMDVDMSLQAEHEEP